MLVGLSHVSGMFRSLLICREKFGMVTESFLGVEGDRDQGRHAVVGVLHEGGQFLVIRRSEKVRAPGLICFPGGGVELGEGLEQAVRRELMEELGLPVVVLGHFWTTQTRWGTRLEWMVCEREVGVEPVRNPEEVSEVIWAGARELAEREDLLGSMPEFLEGYVRGDFKEWFGV